MGNRIVKIFASLFIVTGLCLPLYAQESLPVSAVGIRDFHHYYSRDFSPEQDDDDIFLVNEDYLGFVVFEAFKNEYGLGELKRVIDGMRDEKLRDTMMLELLYAARERGLLPEFRILYETTLLQKKKERILLAMSIEENNPYRYSFMEREVIAYRDAYALMSSGRFAAAVDALSLHAGAFPHTYYYCLMRTGRYREAYEFVAGRVIAEAESMKAKALYMLGDCDRLLDALRAGADSYDERLISIDCKIGKGAGDSLETEFRQAAVPQFVDDDFWVLRKFITSKLEKEPFFQGRYRTFYYRWKLSNYARYLLQYSDEIKEFQTKLKAMENDFKQISEQYQKAWSQVEREDVGRNLRERYLGLDEVLARIGKIRLSLVSDGTSIYKYFSEKLVAGRNDLKNAYGAYASLKEREAGMLRKEAAFRMTARQLEEPEKLEARELLDIYQSLKARYAEAVSEKLTFEEAAAFGRVYALWEYYLRIGLTDAAQNDTMLNQVMEEIDFYLKRYDKRKKQILLLRAEAFDRRGDYDRAFAGYQEYFAMGGDIDGRTYFKVAEILFDRKDYEKAIGYYLKAQERSPVYKNVAYYKIGWCYYKMSLFGAVADLYLGYDFESFKDKREVVLGEMLDLLAKAFYTIGDETALEGYMARYPGFPYPDRLFRQLGDLYLFLADYDNAEKVYEKGFSRYYLYENSHELMSALIEIKSMTGREKEAYRQRARYLEAFGAGSAYQRRFGVIPKNYRDVLLSTALYYDAAYARDKDAGSYDTVVKLYGMFLGMFRSDPQAGEVAFLLGQLKEDKNEFAHAVELYSLALELKFREEDSIYKSVYCRYRLWQEKKGDTGELIAAMEGFTSRYPGSVKSLSVHITAAEIHLHSGNERSMFASLDRAVAFQGGTGVVKAMQFAEENGSAINDKRMLAALFEKGWNLTGDRHNLEMKHYTLFSLAREIENRNDSDGAAVLYEQVMNDSDSTVFREFSTYNYALIIQKRGDTRRSLELMSTIKGGDELGAQAKNFVLVYGKQEKMYRNAAAAAEELAVMDGQKRAFYLLDAGWLYLKAGDGAAAEKVIGKLRGAGLAGEEQADFDVLQGAALYAKADYDGALKAFQAAPGRSVRVEWQHDLTVWYSDSVARVIAKRELDEARDIVGRLVDYLSERMRISGDNTLVFLIGSVLNDYASYFVRKAEVIARSREFLRKALTNASKAGDSAMVLKAVKKLKEAGAGSYERRMSVPETDIKTPLLKIEWAVDKGLILDRNGGRGGPLTP